MLGKLFYQTPLDSHDNLRPPRPILNTLNQRLMEAGVTTPWILTQTQAQEFWSTLTNDEQNMGNRPADYAQKPQEIVTWLHQFWSPEVGTDSSLLELGCNAGANLKGLYDLGYRRLAAIEINPHAIAEMGRVFPEVAATARISEGGLEEWLPQLPTNCFDVLFSMAVLIHVHPASRAIFPEMVRVARKYIAVMELETSPGDRIFARDYRRVFERLGCREVRSTVISPALHPQVSREYYGYTARLFAVPEARGRR